MANFLTIGEPLILFASQDIDEKLSMTTNFKKFLAGAELNVAIGVSRLGHKAIYVTEIGNDMNKEYILKELSRNNIETTYVSINSKYKTGLYFKQKVSKGDPKVSYYRKNSAMSHYSINNLQNIRLDNINLVHISGILAAISSNCVKVINSFMNMLNKKNITISFDPNLRPILWKNEEIMKKTLNNLAKKSQIVMPGINEAKILTGLNDLEDICNFYLNNSKKTNVVIIKNGSKSVYVKERNKKSFEINTYKVSKVVDTVGAGDGFAVGVITGLMENKSLEESVKRGCAIGAMAVQSIGDNTGYPTVEKLEKFMKGN